MFQQSWKPKMTIKNHQRKTEKSEEGGVERGTHRYSHSQHKLVTTYTGGGGLWITVHFKNRRYIRQAVHTSSHNKQYMFMPVLCAPDLTELDGSKQYGIDLPRPKPSTLTTIISPRHPILSDPDGVMEEGEDLLFVLAAWMWNEWDGSWMETFIL